MALSKNKCEIPFGKPTRDALYPLDPILNFTNHGSYGTAPKLILERKRELQNEMELCPDRWFGPTSFQKWNESLQARTNKTKNTRSEYNT